MSCLSVFLPYDTLGILRGLGGATPNATANGILRGLGGATPNATAERNVHSKTRSISANT